MDLENCTLSDLRPVHPVLQSKRYKIVHEILTTERRWACRSFPPYQTLPPPPPHPHPHRVNPPLPARSYVKSLQLIQDVFVMAFERANRPKVVVPKEILATVFSNSKELLKLHTGVLLQLEQRLANWEQEDGIGDLFARLAPFLKVSRGGGGSFLRLCPR